MNENNHGNFRRSFESVFIYSQVEIKSLLLGDGVGSRNRVQKFEVRDFW